MGSAGDPVGVEYDFQITKNSTIITQSRFFPQTENGLFKDAITCSGVLSVEPGDTITTNVYQSCGGNRFIHTSGTYLTIQQLPSLV
jgi:hypothetical protein